jgi:hypothetical protein
VLWDVIAGSCNDAVLLLPVHTSMQTLVRAVLFVVPCCVTQVWPSAGPLDYDKCDNGAATGLGDELCDLHVHFVQQPPAVSQGANTVLLGCVAHEHVAGTL